MLDALCGDRGGGFQAIPRAQQMAQLCHGIARRRETPPAMCDDIL
jgi:hypothetical protein